MDPFKPVNTMHSIATHPDLRQATQPEFCSDLPARCVNSAAAA